jgi:hypothetical protein
LHLRIHGDPRSGSAFWEALDREVRELENCGQMLTRLLKYPELELSHNLAETSMRSVALGEKLDTRRQPTGRAEVGSDFFGGGDLS